MRIAALLMFAHVGLALAQPDPTADYALDEKPIDRPVRRAPRHFSDLSGELPSMIFTSVAVDPEDPEVYLAGADGVVFKSDDGGESWRPVLTFPKGLFAVGADGGTFDPLGRALVQDRDADLRGGRGADGVDDALTGLDPAVDDLDSVRDGVEENAADVARSNVRDRGIVDPADTLPDGDGEVNALPFPRQAPGVRRLHFSESTPGVVYAATPAGLWRSTDSGDEWTRFELPGGPFGNDVRDVASDPNAPGRLYLATASGVWIGTLKALRRGPDRLGLVRANALVVADRGGVSVVVVGTDQGVFRSSDSGRSFRNLLLKGQSPFEPVGVVAYDPRTRITYAGTQQGLFASERGGAILEARQSLFGRLITALSVDPKRLRGVAVGARNAGISESENTGLSLVSLSEPLPAEHVLDIARPSKDTDGYLLATERGVFRHMKGTGLRVNLDRLRALRNEIKREPTIAETLRQALKYARLSTSYIQSARTRARVAAFLPELRVSFRYAGGDGTTFNDSILDEIAQNEFGEDFRDLDVDDRELVVDLAQQLQFDDTDNQYQVFAIATWDLDRLIFSDWETQATRRLPEAALAEQRIANRIRTLYIARRRLLAERLLGDKKLDSAQRVRRTMKMAELTAVLDGLTNGWFTREAKSRGAVLEEISEFYTPRPPEGVTP